ncbi:hypothetical protein [Candidatus Nanohalobium constans]|nr:hypothetical protein [Candidatus Nanohalobium constans]
MFQNFKLAVEREIYAEKVEDAMLEYLEDAKIQGKKQGRNGTSQGLEWG